METEKISAALADRNIAKVAEATGLHRNTLSRIKLGETVKLSAGTRRLLLDYLFPIA